VDDPFDEPDSPEVICDTDKESPEESAAKIVAFLRSKGFLPAAAPGGNGHGDRAGVQQRART
jgi:hypothetical protein